MWIASEHSLKVVALADPVIGKPDRRKLDEGVVVDAVDGHKSTFWPMRGVPCNWRTSRSAN